MNCSLSWPYFAPVCERRNYSTTEWDWQTMAAEEAVELLCLSEEVKGAEVRLSDNWVNFFWPIGPNGDESAGDGDRCGDHSDDR